MNKKQIKTKQGLLITSILLTLFCIVGTIALVVYFKTTYFSENEYGPSSEYEEPSYDQGQTEEGDELPPPDSAETRYLVRKALDTGDKADLEAAAAALTGVSSDNASTDDAKEPYVAHAPEEPIAKDTPMDDSSYGVGDEIIITADKAILRASPSYSSSAVGYWVYGDETVIYDIQNVNGVLWVNTHPTKDWWIPIDDFSFIDQD